MPNQIDPTAPVSSAGDMPVEMALNVNLDHKLVVFRFMIAGSPAKIEWMALRPDTAEMIGKALIEHAQIARGVPASVVRSIGDNIVVLPPGMTVAKPD